MGTLTANQSRLPEYCEHKLPTSCRLSSIPNCCACADERAHVAAYSTYIDGVGFVPRGNRWQRYCWFCREFWAERVRISGLRSGQTRIPEVPDQSEFLESWYDFWRGYRSVKHEDGREERVAVLGEDFKEVSPGCLPRTLDEMRAGRYREEVVQRIVRSEATVSHTEAGPTMLDETLDELFAEAESESRQVQQSPSAPARPSARLPSIHAQAMSPGSLGAGNREYQARRVAALRRELNRMRSGIERVISGLQDLGEIGPNHTEATDAVRRLDSLLDDRTTQTEQAVPNQQQTTVSAADRTASSFESRMNTARARVNTARRERARVTSELGQVESEFRESQQHLEQIQREQRTMENYTRIFGTREEMQAQGENYESPIGGMFTRAMDRFRAAEDVRREQRTLRRVLEDETTNGGEEAVRRLAELETQERDVWGVPQQQRQPAEQVPPPRPGRMVYPTEIMESRRLREQQRARQFRDDQDAEAISAPHPEHPAAAARTQSRQYRSARERHARDQEIRERPTQYDDDHNTPPVLTDTNEESMLEEYYGMLRQHGWNSQWDRNEAEAQTDDGEFPQNMLDAIRLARGRELAERNDDNQPTLTTDGTIAEPSTEHEINETSLSPRGHMTEDQWWHADAEEIIRALTTGEDLRIELEMSTEVAAAMLSYFVDDIVSEQDRATIDALMRNPRAIWGSGLPSEWVKRRSERLRMTSTQGLFLTAAEDPSLDTFVDHVNPYMKIEVVAQAYMMSAEVRRRAQNLSPPTRLQLLYRLQSGKRMRADVEILTSMQDDLDTYHLALGIYEQYALRREDDGTRDAREAMVLRRRMRARDGDHSRQGLNSRRREVANVETDRAMGIAAARRAMQTGSSALMAQAGTDPHHPIEESMLESDYAELVDPDGIIPSLDGHEQSTDETDSDVDDFGFVPRLADDRFNPRFVDLPQRAEVRRMRGQRTLSASGFNVTGARSRPLRARAADIQAPARGLDASPTRPEPKEDEELRVQMECKICYTQLSEVACLPCGHLVMCRWCSEQHSPCLPHDRTRPRRAAQCPVCRKGVRQKVWVYRA